MKEPRFLRLAPFVLAALMAALPVHAETQSPSTTPETPEKFVDACGKEESAAARLSACTSIIEAHLLQGEELAYVHLQRGLGYAALQQYESAIKDFDVALKIEPKATDALYNRGSAYLKLNRPTAALADFDQLLKIAPNDPNTLYLRAWIFAQQGQDEKAISDLDLVLRQFPRDRDALMDRGGLNLRAGHFDKAIVDFSTYLEVEPKAAAAAYNRGRAHFAMAEFTRAAEDFALAEKLRQNNPYAALRLYLSEARLGKGDQGQLAKAAASLEPDIWPRQLLDLYVGKMTTETLLSAQATVPAKDRAAIQCEANYYLGQLALLKGDQESATSYFKAAVETKAKTSIEYIDSLIALRQATAGAN